MKKGQSMLEYLMVYGWAILIIIIVGGVLYYYGVFEPAALTAESEKPVYEEELTCVKWCEEVGESGLSCWDEWSINYGFGPGWVDKDIVATGCAEGEKSDCDIITISFECPDGTRYTWTGECYDWERHIIRQRG